MTIEEYLMNEVATIIGSEFSTLVGWEVLSSSPNAVNLTVETIGGPHKTVIVHMPVPIGEMSI